MTAEDTAILDRVERLAYQAGMWAAGRGAMAPEPKPESKPKVDSEFNRRMRAVAANNQASTGEALYAADFADNLRWEDVRRYVAELDGGR